MKYRIINLNTGKKYKCKEGEMLTLNPDGQAFLVTGIGDYYTGIQRLSNVVPSYVIEFAMERGANGRWIYEVSVIHE